MAVITGKYMFLDSGGLQTPVTATYLGSQYGTPLDFDYNKNPMLNMFFIAESTAAGEFVGGIYQNNVRGSYILPNLTTPYPYAAIVYNQSSLAEDVGRMFIQNNPGTPDGEIGFSFTPSYTFSQGAYTSYHIGFRTNINPTVTTLDVPYRDFNSNEVIPDITRRIEFTLERYTPSPQAVTAIPAYISTFSAESIYLHYSTVDNAGKTLDQERYFRIENGTSIDKPYMSGNNPYGDRVLQVGLGSLDLGVIRVYGILFDLYGTKFELRLKDVINDVVQDYVEINTEPGTINDSLYFSFLIRYQPSGLTNN